MKINYKNILYYSFVGLISLLILLMIIDLMYDDETNVQRENFKPSGDKFIDDKVNEVLNNEILNKVLGKEKLEQLANESFGTDDLNAKEIPEGFKKEEKKEQKIDDHFDVVDGDGNDPEQVKQTLNDVIGPYDTIYHKKSKYQDIQVIKFKKNEKGYDKCLMLNYEPQLCNNDEIEYHELIVHFPAAYLSKIDNVLIIGGGDCMTLREVMKYNVKKVVMLELDQEVINTSKKYFNQSDYKNDSRVNIIIGDATKNIQKLPNNSFDLVIIDTTEDSGNNSPIDNINFIKECHNKTLKDGVFIKNGENRKNIVSVSEVFKYMDMFVINKQTFLGDYKFILGSNTVDFRNASTKNKETHDLCNKKEVKYYDIKSQKGHYLNWN